MTEDIQKRIFQHNNPIHNSKFTAKGVSWELFIAIPCEDKQHALKLEKIIKSKKSSAFIHNLKKYPDLVEKIKNEAHLKVNQSR